MVRTRTWLALTSAARRLSVGDNALRRSWDRIESIVLVVVFVLALVAVPFAAWVGASVYHSGVVRAAEQAATRRETVAVVLQDAPSRTEGPDTAVVPKVSVPGQWRLPDGAERVGDVTVEVGTRAGTSVPVWLDPSGTPTGRPITRDEVAWQAVFSGLAALTGALLALAAGFRVVRWRLDRARLAWWDLEWERIEPRWSQRKT